MGKFSKKKTFKKGGKMKFKTLFYLFLVFLISIGLNAQFFSFRSLSTGGILDDDLEAIYSLTEMTNIEGFNLYTNLSNLTLSEQLINGISQNYMVGLKGSLMDMLHFGLISVSNKNSNTDSSITEDRVFRDTNGDQIYDLFNKETIQDYSSYTSENSDNYFGFLFGKKEGVKVGLSYSRDFYKYAESMQTITAGLDSNIISSSLIATYFEDYNYDYLSKNKIDLFNLAVGFAAEKMEITGSFNFAFLTVSSSYVGRDTIFNNFAPGNSSIHNYDKSDNYSNRNYVSPRFNLGFGLKGYYRMNEDSLEFFTGLQNNSYKPFYLFDDEYNASVTVTPGLVTDEIYSSIDSVSTLDSASVINYSLISLGIGGKYVKKIENAYFGIGLAFSQSKSNEIDTIHYLLLSRENYDNGDGVTDINDYTYTETGSYTQESIENNLISTITVPVGVEYNFLKNLFGRLGARTTFSWSNNYQSDRVLAYSPVIGEYIYGDGSNYQVIIENPSQREDSNTKSKGFSYNTQYTYGLGWQISKNLKLDIMGFSNLIDLSTWSFSLNVKF